MSEAPIPYTASVRVLPAFAVVERHNRRWSAHRISKPRLLPHFREREQ